MAQKTPDLSTPSCEYSACFGRHTCYVNGTQVQTTSPEGNVDEQKQQGDTALVLFTMRCIADYNIVCTASSKY